MADIELVIKLNEKTYKDIKNGKVYSSVRDVPLESILAIANGTLLPKRHGRLIDADDLSLATVHLIDGMFVCDAPTIIAAYKSESEAI